MFNALVTYYHNNFYTPYSDDHKLRHRLAGWGLKTIFKERYRLTLEVRELNSRLWLAQREARQYKGTMEGLYRQVAQLTENEEL